MKLYDREEVDALLLENFWPFKIESEEESFRTDHVGSKRELRFCLPTDS